MRVLLPILGLLAALNAEALTINFSGEVNMATSGNFGFDVGDSFTGQVTLDDAQKFIGASLFVEGSPWAISFVKDTMQGISISTTMIALSGNPHQFWATLTLFLDNGQVTGGTASANSEPFMNHGYFEGTINPAASLAAASQPVPETGCALGLLAIGCALVAMVRFHRNSTGPLT